MEKSSFLAHVFLENYFTKLQHNVLQQNAEKWKRALLILNFAVYPVNVGARGRCNRELLATAAVRAEGRGDDARLKKKKKKKKDWEAKIRKTFRSRKMFSGIGRYLFLLNINQEENQLLL